MADRKNGVFWSIAAAVMLAAGAAVFLIRLQHAGPYALPGGGNLRAGILALALGLWLARPWLGARSYAVPLRFIALGVSLPVLFFALYATFAELEEVVTLRANDQAGQPADLRLWIVDQEDGAWVTMPRSKAEAHGLDGAEVKLLRGGEFVCVRPTRIDDRAAVERVHQLRDQKYVVQRLATRVGLFGETAGASTVALRLDPCDSPR